MDSEHLIYWVSPPNEALLPQFELGQPMEMQYTMANDKFLSEHVLAQMERLIKHYPNLKSAPNFAASHSSESPLNKLGRSLIPKFPKDQGRTFWQFIKTKLIHKQNGSGMAIPSDDQIITKLLTKLETSSRLTTAASSSSSTPAMIVMSSLGVGGGSNGATIIGSRNSFSAGDDEEEEIDDDEDNALLSRRDSGRGVHHAAAAALAAAAASGSSSSSAAATAVSTEEVISLLLQRQAPVAPRAHEASSIASIVRGEGGPLDYSAITSIRPK